MNSSSLALPTPLSSSCALREVSRHVPPLGSLFLESESEVVPLCPTLCDPHGL